MARKWKRRIQQVSVAKTRYKIYYNDRQEIHFPTEIRKGCLPEPVD